MLHLCMPIGHRYTCAVATNDPYKGLLHMYIRHFAEFENQIPGLLAQRLMLPAAVQQKMQNISNAANIHAVSSDVTALMNSINSRSVKNTFYKAQLMILAFLQRVVNTMYAGSTRTASGKYQLLYAVKGAPSQLKLAPSTYLKAPNPQFSSNKPVRHIITAFF